ncbi:MAG: hypothetical protein KAV83_07345 [Desulfobacterales bacterium]|nr:hypothetical protein [Desulfobacterales bacterium]
MPPLTEKAAYAMHAGRHGPEPRVNKSLIVAAEGHRKGPTQTDIHQTAIQMERVRCVLQPEGKTLQENVSCSEVIGASP